MENTIEEVEKLIVPDGFTPVIGFRRFGIPWPPSGKDDYYLAQRGHRWSPGEPTVAECRRPGTGPCAATVPTQDCGCGLHAWLEVEEALRYYELTTAMGWVLASVIGWGKVLFDEDFWRAQMAQVVAFADPTDTHSHKPQIVQKRAGRWLEKVAENYEVPILPLEELREYTLEYGEEYIEDHG